MISKNRFKRNLQVFQSCDKEYKDSSVVIFSSPMDATCSFRPGTRFAGPAIRQDSIGMEWYSPYFNMDLKDYGTCDIGDLDLPMGDVEKDLKEISRVTSLILKDGKKTMMIGGEHLVTLGTIREYVKKYKDLNIIHFDAHTDLREEFLGRELSHATVLRKCYDLLDGGTIYQFGIRSGDRSEFEWAKTHIHQHLFDTEGLDEAIEALKDKPVYITIDLDVLDPSVFPGTGTPEAGGITFKELEAAILKMRKLNNIVGADMVELSPDYDTSHVSTQVACKVLRELVLLLHSHDNN
ncbi:MAG: agmatinase [Bacilli bacterium]|nr:agmatinase [Bacilli bacterium]MCI7622401.1 agmatinase [Bacilli bacterium]MDD7375116.1 agmatinase [Bacilli bacterium]MDD7549658.1 agmatinase [Bacilli bacterium]MDD7598120.1 agmatinase [Bacilli bacterium]